MGFPRCPPLPGPHDPFPANGPPCEPLVGAGSVGDLVAAALQDLRGSRHQGDSVETLHVGLSYVYKCVPNLLTDDVVAAPSEGALSDTAPMISQSLGGDFQSPVPQGLQILAYAQWRLSERSPVSGSHPEDTLQVPVHQKTGE